MKNATVAEVFDRVGRKTGLDFFYNNEKINAYKRVDLKLKNADLPFLFQTLFPDSQIKYEIVNKCVLITDLIPRTIAMVTLIKGVVTDEFGNPLPRVHVRIGELLNNYGTSTDAEGVFALNVFKPEGKQLEFSFIGYEKNTRILKANEREIKIVLKQKITELNECVVTGYGEQTKISVVGAIADVDLNRFAAPDGAVSNLLAGRVAGVIAFTRSGEPGNDFSEFWIRGISTFGAGQKPLVLIDGIEGNINDLNTEDIERFSVLKDASSTALYGVRGANGVILIQTKRGKAGPTRFGISSSVTLSHSALEPQYLPGTDYATLVNEANVVRGGREIYSPLELELINDKLDPDFYPDVDWQKVILNPYTWNHQHRIFASGGGQGARFFLSAGVTDKSALYHTEKIDNYDPNVNWKQYTARANLDFSLAPKSQLSLSTNVFFINQIKPGYQERNAVWNAISNMNPLTVPIRYSDGSLPGLGENEYETSPFVLLNYTGYSQEKTNDYRFDLGFKQQIDWEQNHFVFQTLLSLKSSSINYHYRLKHPETYRAESRAGNGALIKKLLHPAQNFNYSGAAFNQTFYYGMFQLTYKREITSHHHLEALINGYMQDKRKSYDRLDHQPDDLLPERYQALAGRIVYHIQNKYFAEFNFGYTGSENFPPGEQFNFFPSVGLAWILINNQTSDLSSHWINFLKMRASWGRVGNDRIDGQKFPWLDRLAFEGVDSKWGSDGITETFVGTKNLRWEMAEKYNVGIDFKLKGETVVGSFDVYRNYMKGIFQKRLSIPQEVGVMVSPYMNIGRMYSQGVDAEIKWHKQFGAALSMRITGNFTYTENKIKHWEEFNNQLPYQLQKEYPYRVNRGLIALGLFADSLDIIASPRQILGEVRPGDIKYKDVNGDGKIDLDDVVPLKNTDIPQIMYGLSTELKFRNWTFGLFFTGVSQVSTFYGGEGVYPFAQREKGNVLAMVKDHHWTPAWYSGKKETEDPHARFPRLTYGKSENNNQPSTFWLKQTSYVRLKMLELGYSFNHIRIARKQIEELNIQFFGENLFLWSPQKKWGWDPEQLSSNAAVYPIQRKFSIRLEMVL